MMKLLILAGLAALALAAPKATTNQKLQVNVLEQNIFVSEQVELTDMYSMVSMPEHNNLVAATVLTDHASGLTLRVMPGSQHCYLLKNDPSHVPAKEMWSEENTHAIWTNTPNTTVAYRIQQRLTDRSVLTPKMREICPTFPLYEIVVDDHQEELRSGVFFPLNGKQSPAAKGCSLETCPIMMQGQVCSAVDNHCHYIMMCHIEIIDGKETSVCNNEHKFGTVRCCTTCCLMQPTPGPTCLPYCMSGTVEDWEKCEGYGKKTAMENAGVAITITKKKNSI